MRRIILRRSAVDDCIRRGAGARIQLDVDRAVVLARDRTVTEHVHRHALGEQTCSERLRRERDRVGQEIDPLVPRLRVAAVDAPVRLHRRGHQLPQRTQESEAEIPVLEREKREECMLSSGAEPLQLEALGEQRGGALGRHEVVHVHDVRDVAAHLGFGQRLEDRAEEAAVRERIDEPHHDVRAGVPPAREPAMRLVGACATEHLLGDEAEPHLQLQETEPVRRRHERRRGPQALRHERPDHGGIDRMVSARDHVLPAAKHHVQPSAAIV